MTIHRSIKVDADMWARMEARAQHRGYASTNGYIRALIQEDLSRGSTDEMEERLVTTISQLSARVQSLGTMHQASFATLWAVVEMILNGLPAARAGVTQATEDRLKDVRKRIAGDIRRNAVLKEFSEP